MRRPLPDSYLVSLPHHGEDRDAWVTAYVTTERPGRHFPGYFGVSIVAAVWADDQHESCQSIAEDNQTDVRDQISDRERVDHAKDQ